MDCGCKDRKELLKTWGKDRRGFFQKAAMGAVAFTLGAKSMKAQQAAAHDALAMQVLRFLNTASHRHNAANGKFVSFSELASSQVVADLRVSDIAEKKNQGRSLIEQINFDGPEVIPGWELIHRVSPDGKKYSATLKTVGNTSFTFTTNEEAIIETGQPLMVRGGLLGRIFASAFRCIGPIGEPGCCCYYPCCDQCHCEASSYCQRCACCFNCGCTCCVWCADNCI